MKRSTLILTGFSANYLALLLSGLTIVSVPRAAWSAESPTNERAAAARFEAGKPDLYQATGVYVRTELRFTFDPPSAGVGNESIRGDATRRGPRVSPPSAAVGDEPIQVFIHGTSTGVFTRAWSWWDGVKRVIPVDAAGLRREGDSLRGEIRWAVSGVGSEWRRSVTNAIALEAQVNETLVQGTFWRLLKYRHSERRLTKDSEKGGSTAPIRKLRPPLTEPVPSALDALDDPLEGKTAIDTEVEPPAAARPKIQPDVFCIELETGKMVAVVPCHQGGVTTAYLGQETLAADGMLMDNDATCLMSADPKALRVLGGSGLPTKPAGWTASAIADGRLFIRMSGPMEGLACYDLREESK